MRCYLRFVALALALLIGGGAWAQGPKGWLGADLQDVIKAEADKLGWDTPHGAKLGIVAPSSPAEKAGLKTGDIILSIDRTEIDTVLELSSAVEGKRPGAEIRLRVISGARERPVTVSWSCKAIPPEPPPYRYLAASHWVGMR